MATNDSKANPRKSGLGMAEIIRGEVSKQKWTARELARVSKVPQPTVTRFLNGADLRLETATKICRVVGLELRKV